MVFVLDRKKRPLMPCTPKRARLLLARGRAVIHRVQPFVIRLKDRHVEDAIYCYLVQRADGYDYGISLRRTSGESLTLSPAPSKERLLPPYGSKPGASAGGGFR
jgi:hypothetical protein